MERTFERRVALVTGAAGGIGTALCAAFAARGATVVGVDRSSLDAVAEVVTGFGGQWLAIEADLADATTPLRIAVLVDETYGRCDVLVNNAAIDDAVGWDDLDFELWRRVMAIDLEAPFHLCRAIVPLMRRHAWGRIVNIGSGSVLNPMGGFVAYRAAKMGLIGFSRALATEVGNDGITVNVVSPGVTNTPMVAASLPPGTLESAAQARAIKRVAEPEDVAGAVLMLAGDDAAFVTGQTVLANGGATFI